MYSPIYHPLSQTWLIGKIKNHTAIPLTKEEATNIADLLNGSSWTHVSKGLPEKGEVIMISLTGKDKDGVETEGVGMAAFNGITFNDFDGKVVFGVNLWMQIPPRAPVSI